MLHCSTARLTWRMKNMWSHVWIIPDSNKRLFMVRVAEYIGINLICKDPSWASLETFKDCHICIYFLTWYHISCSCGCGCSGGDCCSCYGDCCGGCCACYWGSCGGCWGSWNTQRIHHRNGYCIPLGNFQLLIDGGPLAYTWRAGKFVDGCFSCSTTWQTSKGIYVTSKPCYWEATNPFWHLWA